MSIVELAAAYYVEIIEFALPISIVFGLGNIVINMLLSAAFGGRLQLGGKMK